MSNTPGIPALIVMLTHNDRTVSNAHEVFDQCKNTQAKYWGFKEEGLPLSDMQNLYSFMRDCGKTTVLEVVAYTEEECLKGAHMAHDCSVDILMGTHYFDSVHHFCIKHNITYMPFVGQISGRPSVLEGDIESLVKEAQRYLEKGVYGVDLLGYRFTGDAKVLNQQFVEQVQAPVCLAGSVNSYERLAEVREANPWAFTIGGAFFESKFGSTFEEQINNVCAYMSQGSSCLSQD